MTPSKVFVREATGLVRTYSPLEVMYTNFGGTCGVMPVIGFTTWMIWFGTPGGDEISTMIAALLFSAFGLVGSYAFLSASMPRSGGR